MQKQKLILEPYDFKVPILFEDDSLLVVNKPAGLVSHPACGHPQDTLVNALIHKLNPQVGESDRPGMVHRLDKDVSGLLVLSKTEAAHSFLAKQFINKKVLKFYQAICWEPFRWDEGKIETFIKRHPADRKKFIRHPSEGKKAVTLFKILQKDSHLAFVEFQLITGRTHQARLHSLEFSGGIVGDSVYSSSKKIKKVRDSSLAEKIKNLKRIALHAARLSFIHPETKKEVHFKAPLPQELQEILDDCRLNHQTQKGWK